MDYPEGNANLGIDIHDVPRDLLIEAKATGTRENLRYAIGQVYDYGRSFARRSRCSCRPVRTTIWSSYSSRPMFGVIWEHKTQFEEELV